uniref:Uncharacterized protein n=1 Tax=Helianthus annuus TaxID=4232 RepID=A0A251RLC8_HELAN
MDSCLAWAKLPAATRYRTSPNGVWTVVSNGENGCIGVMKKKKSQEKESGKGGGAHCGISG